jgi:hypothetical protein
VSVVTAPTTSGVVTFACWTRPGGEYIGEQDCDDASRGLRVAAGEALPPAPDVAARIALPAVVDRLDARRAAGRRALARGRFSAAGDVAAAYADAAAALRPLAGGRALALTRRLGATAGAYSELERAHAQQSRGKAVRAAGRITRGEARLQALLRDLAPAAQRRAE